MRYVTTVPGPHRGRITLTPLLRKCQRDQWLELTEVELLFERAH